MNSKTIFSILGIIAAVGIVAGLGIATPVQAFQVNGGTGSNSFGTTQAAGIGGNIGTVGAGNTANANACALLAVC